MQAGINLEFAKTEGLDILDAIEQASAAGYRYVEPYIYSASSLRINSHLTVTTESPYHHLHTDTADVPALAARLAASGVQFSAFDAHTTMLLPEIGVPYLKRAIDLAAQLNCPYVMSDEGPIPAWMPLDRAFDIFCISLEETVRYAQERGVLMTIELHNPLTTNKTYLERLLARFSPQELGINFDTGNSFLAGNDPVAFLDGLVDRVVHVHAKDIPEWQLVERGKVTGTRVGVAIGDGVIDFPAIIAKLHAGGYKGVISVECDTYEEASKSRTRLEEMIAVHG